MIRQTQHEDRDRIEELYKILIPEDDEINVLNERIDEFKIDPNQFLFVYEIEGRVEGTILLTFCLDAMYGNKTYAIVENIIVDPASWGKGIGKGKGMLNHIENCCREVNCREILLLSNTRRTEAHAFFERQGFNLVAKGYKKYLD